MLEIIAAGLVLVVALWVIWQLFAIVGDMAESRGQNALLWQVASLFINPIMAMLLLWMFCDLENPSA